MIIKDYLKELFDGRILYDDLSVINENLSLCDQIDNLQEDLLQVASINKQYLLDVGWYPEMDIKGCFKVIVIKRSDWENPIYVKEAFTIEALKDALLECKLSHKF